MKSGRQGRPLFYPWQWPAVFVYIGPMANPLFKRFSSALKKEASQAFKQSPLGAVIKHVRDSRGGGKMTRQVKTLFKKYAEGGAAETLKGFSGSSFGRMVRDIHKYAKSGSGAGKLVQAFLGELGPFGSLINSILDGAKGGGKIVANMSPGLRTALSFIEAFSDQPEVLSALQRILENQGARVSWGQHGQPGDTKARTRQTPGQAEGENLPIGARVKTMPTGRQSNKVQVIIPGVGPKSFPRNHPIITGDMVPTPESSNVFSFGYDIDSFFLYIRFRQAPEGEKGSHGTKPFLPGPIYSYRNVPVQLFLKMLSAPSKGTFIWDKIRIRGTVSGHRFDYALAGVQGDYVPRKATLTPRGEEYISRSVFTDSGKVLQSRHPDELVRPLIPLPRRGSPNTGRP